MEIRVDDIVCVFEMGREEILSVFINKRVIGEKEIVWERIRGVRDIVVFGFFVLVLEYWSYCEFL